MPAAEEKPASADVASTDWRRFHAFGLPDGSVRALLAVAIFATIWTLLVWRPTHVVPDYLRNLLFIIMGHYFATRRRDTRPMGGPGPLFLPRGTIRWILFGGFLAVGIVLIRGGQFRDPVGNPGVVTLMLVAGFLLGVLVARFGDWRREKGHPTPRWVEDLRASLALVATAVLIFLIWRRFDANHGPDEAEPFVIWNLRLAPYTLEHVMSAVVGFYFGSRS